jgi:hypothetical protein
MAYPIQWGARCKELIAESPFRFIVDTVIFPHFLLETGSVICSGNRLAAID